jgi:hypothetical protein
VAFYLVHVAEMNLYLNIAQIIFYIDCDISKKTAYHVQLF